MYTDEYPSKLLERAVSECAKLPGVGRRTALRLVLHLLGREASDTHALAQSLMQLRDEVKYCRCCHNISDTDLCDLCANPQRDHTTLCVVENVRSVLSIENTGMYRGVYHVLGGLISPLDGIGPKELTVESLAQRAESADVQEVIFALSPTMEGDTTSFYLQRRIAREGLRLSRLSRGMSVGDELEYTDEVTLGRALTERTPMV